MRSRVEGLQGILGRVSPAARISIRSERVESLRHDLRRLMTYQVSAKRHEWKETVGRLESMSPLNVLSRGYSIAQLMPSGRILRGVEGVHQGDAVRVTLAEGRLECQVDRVHPADRD